MFYGIYTLERELNGKLKGTDGLPFFEIRFFHIYLLRNWSDIYFIPEIKSFRAMK